MSTSVIQKEVELEGVARALLTLAEAAPLGAVIALRGDLGAGKTALTKAIARILDVHETVTSPTFVIMKSYPVPHHDRFTTLTHIDAYRIEHDDELRVLGFEELLADRKRLTVIEWPERVHGRIPQHAILVDIAIQQNGERSITYGT